MSVESKYKSLSYIAGHTGFSEAYIRKLVTSNKIPHYKFEKRYFFLTEEIDKWFEERKVNPGERNVIAIANQKGGAAKTTLTFNMGYNLAALGYKVLMIDLDPQGSLSFIMGAQGTVPKTIYNMFEDMFDNNKVNCNDYIYQSLDLSKKTILNGDIVDAPIGAAHKNLNILPSDLRLTDIRNRLETDMIGRNILKHCIETVKSDYDYILIDTLPSDLGVFLQSALLASQYVIVPEYPDVLTTNAMTGLFKLINKVKAYNKDDKLSLEVLGIAITRAKKNTVYHQEFVDALRKEYFVFNYQVNDTIEIQEATGKGLPMAKYKSKFSDEYHLLLDEIIETIKQRNI